MLGVAWDGTGHGGDGTIWGGEFLAVDGLTRFRRVAHLRPFRLPGGEAAVREPRRAALGLLHAIVGADALAMTELPPVAAFTPRERDVLATMLERGVNAPFTSSAGRLFDAVAALLGLRPEEPASKARRQWRSSSPPTARRAPRNAAAHRWCTRTRRRCASTGSPLLEALIAARLRGCSAEPLAAGVP